jgi:hypothetical protein
VQAIAQTYDESGVVYEAGRNKIGLLKYCRNNALIDPAIADKALEAMNAILPGHDGIAQERGDRAEAAGADGFWELSRRRDIFDVAALFRTTPSSLCLEWAEETLRQPAPKAPNPGSPAISVAVMVPALPGAVLPPPSPEAAAFTVPPLPTRPPLEARAAYARRAAPPPSPPAIAAGPVPFRAPGGIVEAAPPEQPPAPKPPIFTRAAAGSYSLSGFSINIFPCLLRKACSDY